MAYQEGNSEGDLKNRLNVFAESANAIKMKVDAVDYNNYNTASYSYTAAAAGASLTVTSNDVAGQSGVIAYWTYTVYDNKGGSVSDQTATPAVALVIDTSTLQLGSDWTVQLTAKRENTSGVEEKISYSVNFPASLIILGGGGDVQDLL